MKNVVGIFAILGALSLSSCNEYSLLQSAEHDGEVSVDLPDGQLGEIPDLVMGADKKKYCRVKDDHKAAENRDDDDDHGKKKDHYKKMKVLVCHVPHGNPEKAHEILISEQGWKNGHEPHHEGDKLGPCKEKEPAIVAQHSHEEKKHYYKECEKDEGSGDGDAGDDLQ